jgi:hypothetical protein
VHLEIIKLFSIKVDFLQIPPLLAMLKVLEICLMLLLIACPKAA